MNDAPPADGVPTRTAQADPVFTERVPVEFARRQGVLVLASDTDPAVLLHADDAVPPVDIVTRRVRRPLRCIARPRGEILESVERAYAEVRGREIDHAGSDAVPQTDTDLDAEDLLVRDEDGSAVERFRSILAAAVRAGASDLHLEPAESRLRVRHRVDGILIDAAPLPASDAAPLLGRLKVLGGMDVGERRRAQDGRATVHLGRKRVDLRLSVVPATHGERAVVRILDRDRPLQQLNDLGMAAGMRSALHRAATEPGLLLVVGPTGSGKSTTLYALLREIDRRSCNVVTLEDPVEHRLDDITQIQVGEGSGMTFASGLRSLLRQDPDVILVGEIRDRETAVLAVRAALTGHRVYATLHTRTAIGAVSRLVDLGVPPSLVAEAVTAVLSQRLARRSEPDGRRRGRIGLFELLRPNTEFRAAVQTGGGTEELESAAASSGLRPIRRDARDKIAAGVTDAVQVAAALCGDAP